MCSRAPYCSICTLFHTHQQVTYTRSATSWISWRKGYLTRMFSIPKTYRFGGLSGACGQILLLRVERLMSPLLSRHQTKSRNGGESPVVADGGRMRTKPLIPELCFATTTEEDSESKKPPATPYLEEDGTSLLISCSNCSIRVHTSQS